MKKPARAAPAKPAPKAAQPGNRPGRGKAAHAKPAAKPKPVAPKVKAARHAAAVKASKTRAANAKKAKAHPRRQLALGSAVACCSAEALAASLRLSGWPVSDEDVLALYWHTARDEHAGASIVATLEAASEFGLAGVRPLSFRSQVPGDALHHQIADGGVLDVREPIPLLNAGLGSHLPEPPYGDGSLPGGLTEPHHRFLRLSCVHPLILGLALPAPHAVLDTGSEWISWGQAWPVSEFPDVVLEEAWTIRWEVG